VPWPDSRPARIAEVHDPRRHSLVEPLGALAWLALSCHAGFAVDAALYRDPDPGHHSAPGARRGRGRGDYSSLVLRRYFIIGGCILTARLVQAESVCKRSSHWTHQRGSFCETRSAVLDHAGAMKAISSCGVRWRSAKWRPPMRKETSRCHRQFKDSVSGDRRAHCCQGNSWPSVHGYRPDGDAYAPPQRKGSDFSAHEAHASSTTDCFSAGRWRPIVYFVLLF